MSASATLTIVLSRKVRKRTAQSAVSARRAERAVPGEATQVIGAVAAVSAACVAPPELATTEATSVCPASAEVGLYDAPVAPAIGVQSRPFVLHRSQVVA